MRVAFLDDDHVIALARRILLRAEPDRVRAFFAPEVVDVEALFALSAGLHAEEVAPQDAEAIVFRRGRVPRALIEAAPRLRLIQRLGEESGRHRPRGRA